RITYTFDALGQVVKTNEGGDSTSPARITETVRDAAGNVVLVLGPRSSQAARNDYDADNRLIRQYQLVDASTGQERRNEFGYDAVGNNTTFKDPLDRVTTFVLDGLYRQTVVRQPLNKSTTTVYDVGDRVLSVTDALSHTTSVGYDVYDNRTS